MSWIKVSSPNLGKVTGDLRHTARELERGIMQAVQQSAIVAMATARQEAPKFTGTLANSINFRGVQRVVTGRGQIKYQDIVTTVQPHAAVMEEGRRPGAKWPPQHRIARWLDLKVKRGDMQITVGDEEGDYYDRFWFAVMILRKTIAQRGIKARKFFAKAADAAWTELIPALHKLYDRLL